MPPRQPTNLKDRVASAATAVMRRDGTVAPLSLLVQMLFREQKDSLCLSCADLDHLQLLPSGDAAMSRRAKKHRSLSAQVLHFNQRAKRYERRGILVTDEAIALAEDECTADAGTRAATRAKGAAQRAAQDRELANRMVTLIQQAYPHCPKDEAETIAQHTATRGSGRVGRSAAGRDLNPDALRLAVIAHIRHAHTSYDALLASGTPRRTAREKIANRTQEVLKRWEA